MSKTRKRLRVMRTAELGLRISPELKEAARKAAELEQQSLSSLIIRLLVEHCSEAGTLKKRQRSA